MNSNRITFGYDEVRLTSVFAFPAGDGEEQAGDAVEQQPAEEAGTAAAGADGDEGRRSQTEARHAGVGAQVCRRSAQFHLRTVQWYFAHFIYC